MKTAKPYAALLLLLCGLLFGSVRAAGLDAELDRSRVPEGDTVTLVLSAPGDTQADPDLGPLSRDFDIVNRAQSTRTTIINGRASSTRQWTLVLAPKHSGRLQVPPIALGSLSSRVLDLEVLPAAQAAAAGQNRAVVVEAEVEPKEPYVQGQTVYTVRILHRVPMGQATLSDPAAQDALFERLGDDKRYTTTRDGQRYNVIERRYALYPQRSGTLEVEPPVLSAAIPEQERRRDSQRDRLFGRDPFADFGRFFGSDPFAEIDSMFQSTREVRVRGPRLTLDVRAQPPGTASPWLPAESVQLAENWSPDPPRPRVGEPVTRTIAIVAQGVTAAQLPDLAPAVPDGVKVYPDKPQVETRAEGGTIVAKKVLKQALVPSRAGALTLPEVRLAWWDTRANAERVAIAPARTLEVLPAQPGTASAADDQASKPAESADLRETPQPQSAISPPSAHAGQAPVLDSDEPPGSPGSARYWPVIAATLALAWLVTLGLWLRDRKRRADGGAAGKRVGRQHLPPGVNWARVREAFGGNDPRAARQALLAWAATRWADDPPGRLEELARRLSEPAAAVLRELDRRLYGAGSGDWDGAAAWQRLAPVVGEAGRGGRAQGEPALPDLYP